jgi:DNA-binding transcriptional LysR family regulator
MATDEVLNGRHFQIFAALMKSRSQSEAALKLGISEPAISKTIRLIERETGVTLFTRENGRLKPTPQANLLLPQAQRAVRQLDAATHFAYSLVGAKNKPLVVAAHAPPLLAIVSKAVQRMTAARPDVMIDVRVESPLEVLKLVSHHEADIGITNPPSAEGFDKVNFIERTTIAEDLLMVALPATHPLTGKRVIRPNDLRGQPIIALPDDSPTAVLVNATFQEEGVPIQPLLSASNSIGVCSLVQQGVGIGLINPLLLATGIFPDIVLRPFRPRIVLWTEIYTSVLRPLSADAEELVARIEEVAGEIRVKPGRGSGA